MGPENKRTESKRSFNTLLVAYAVSRHHQFLRAGMPFLGFLVDKVAEVHGGSDPRLVELQQVFGRFRERIEEHFEHQQLIDALGRMRALTDDFTAPDWACATYRTMVAELAA